MTTQANELKSMFAWLTINEYKIGLNMTISMVFPLARQGMVAVFLRQKGICNQMLQDHPQFIGYVTMLRCGLDTLVVLLKGAGSLNRPHLNPPSALRLS